MYDSHIFSPDYKDFKHVLIDILNGDDVFTDVHELAEQIQADYDEGSLSSSQYDDLMQYVQEIEENY